MKSAGSIKIESSKTLQKEDDQIQISDNKDSKSNLETPKEFENQFVFKRNNISVYIKILMNYLQFISIIYSLKLEWPSIMQGIFRSSKKAGETSEQLISFDCFIDNRTVDDPDANSLELYFVRVIIVAILPAACIMISALVIFSIFIYDTK